MRKLALALCVLTLLPMAGCGGDKNVNETGYSDEPLVDREGNKLNSADAERLYESAREFMINGDPQRALRLYAEVQARFPFSPYAAQAELESIAAHFRAAEYSAAISAADRFIKQRPRNEHIDYVYYLRAMSNYKRNEAGLLGGDPDKRDMRYLEQAFTDFRLLIENYPQSVYRKDAQLHMIDIRNRLAAFQVYVAEYYLRRRAYVAAARRAEIVIERYQGSESVPRALEIMEESYAKLGLPDLAEDTRAILQASYPNYILHREEFYRQRAGEQPRYELPDMAGAAAAGRTIRTAPDTGGEDSASDAAQGELRPDNPRGRMRPRATDPREDKATRERAAAEGAAQRDENGETAAATGAEDSEELSEDNPRGRMRPSATDPRTSQ